MPALAPAHARSGRGCRQIEAVDATVLPSSALKKTCLGQQKKTLVHGIKFDEPAQILPPGTTYVQTNKIDYYTELTTN